MAAKVKKYAVWGQCLNMIVYLYWNY